MEAYKYKFIKKQWAIGKLLSVNSSKNDCKKLFEIIFLLLFEIYLGPKAKPGNKELMLSHFNFVYL
jgi:hypothetical protein